MNYCTRFHSHQLQKMMQLTNDHGSWCWEVINKNNNELAILVVTISSIILAILWYKLTARSRSSNGAAPPLPPGPRSLPIVGYLPFLSPDLHKQFTNMAHSYGPVFKFHLGSKLHVVINTPELAKEVLRDQDEAFSNRYITVAASVLTYGGQDIVMSKNDSNWRNLRKIFVRELLSNKNLEACASLRKDELRKTIKNVFSNIGTVVDISKIAFLTEASVITNMVWENTSYNGPAEGSRHLGDELQMVSSNIADIFGKPNVSDFFPSLAWLDLQGVKRDMTKQLDKLEQILTSIIEDRIKSNLKGSQADGVGHKDFLQMLLDVKDQKDATSLSITQIKALLLDIMLAGTETTTTFAEWAMAEIMQNHNVMIKVQEELAKIVGANNIVEESHLSQLEYLDATIKETFRLHPVLPFLIPRSPSQDCRVGEYTIPKGCTIFLNVWSIHRDPRYWDKPLDFNPERFLTSSTNKCDYNGNNLKFFPFGSGRRICAGIPLAEKMQMLILASLLHSFDWRLPKGEEHDLSEKFGITLRKRKPLMAIPSQRLPDVRLYN